MKCHVCGHDASLSAEQIAERDRIYQQILDRESELRKTILNSHYTTGTVVEALIDLPDFDIKQYQWVVVGWDVVNVRVKSQGKTVGRERHLIFVGGHKYFGISADQFKKWFTKEKTLRV